MTLKWKIIGILLVFMGLMAVTDHVVDRLVIYPSYVALEKAQAEKDVARCEAALENTIYYLDIVADDWAAWDDTCIFLQDRNAAYIESNLVLETFLDNELNLINYYDVNGNLFWGRAMDLETQAPCVIKPFDSRHLDVSHPLIRHSDAAGGLRGVFLTDKGPMLISSRPIVSSENKGPIRGTLVMGKLLTPTIMTRLVKQTQVPHIWMPMAENSLSDEDQRAAAMATPSSPVVMREKGIELFVYTVMPDVLGAPALLLRAVLPRDITAKGLAGIRYGILSNALVSVVLLLVFLGLLKITVLSPIVSLTRHAVAIRDTGDLSLRHHSRRKDEIGVLSGEFDRLVADQQAIQQGLKHEIEERQRYEETLTDYHLKLRQLSSELLLTGERERRKIAVDLHDHIGQTLAVSKMRLDELASILPAGEAIEKVEKIIGYIEKAIQDTRTLTFEISPPILYEFGLASALKWLGEKFSDLYGLTIKFNAGNADIQLDTPLRIMLFQATRELLFNIVKHAHCSDVKIAMTADGDRLKITIEDNGVGFDPAALNAQIGFGLFNIKERLTYFGGHCEIESAQGKGTRIHLAVPLKPPVADDGQRSLTG